MADQIVPNTQNLDIAYLSVAWEIVRTSTAQQTFQTQEEKKIAVANDVIDVYAALRNGEPFRHNKSE
jgi:hypothetical protein